MMRGKLWCGRHDGFAIMRRIRNDLVGLPVGAPRLWADEFFGAGAPCAEIVTRQFILQRLGGQLNRALFAYLGGINTIHMGMPGPWRDYLVAQGWKVNRLLSGLTWYGMALARWGHGVWMAVRLCVIFWRASSVEVLPEPGKHVVFEGLTLANLPPADAGLTGYDICSFYARWSGRLSGISAICHGVPGIGERKAVNLSVHYRPPVWELAMGKRNALRLMWWAIRASVVAGMHLLAGHWHYAFLLAEAVRAHATRLCPPKMLADGYFFHASGTIYRPLWTYEVQQHGAEVSLYFYSAYDQPKLSRGYEAQNFEWGPANWQRYIVWDACQEAVLKRDLGEQICTIQAGAITFSDSAVSMPALPKNPVAVFDIQPHRPSLYFGISTLSDSLAACPDYYLDFLRDATEVVQECGGDVVFKAKRDIGGRIDKRYKRLLDQVMSRSEVCTIDSGISAMRVSKACVAGISAPFTSTAIYLRECGVPSAYYDPAGWMQRDDHAARGIPILQGKAELRAWLSDVLATSGQTAAGRREASC